MSYRWLEQLRPFESPHNMGGASLPPIDLHSNHLAVESPFASQQGGPFPLVEAATTMQELTLEDLSQGPVAIFERALVLPPGSHHEASEPRAVITVALIIRELGSEDRHAVVVGDPLQQIISFNATMQGRVTASPVEFALVADPDILIDEEAPDPTHPPFTRLTHTFGITVNGKTYTYQYRVLKKGTSFDREIGILEDPQDTRSALRPLILQFQTDNDSSGHAMAMGPTTRYTLDNTTLTYLGVTLD